MPQEEKDAEGDVADALNQEEIGGNLADMSPQDIDELAEVQDLDSNQVQQLQAQVQGARKSSRIAAQAPTTPVGRGTTTLNSQLSPHVENYLERREPPSADVENYLRNERRERRERLKKTY